MAMEVIKYCYYKNNINAQYEEKCSIEKIKQEGDFMKEKIFTDINGEHLIVKHRKSAVFFERIADLEKENRYHPDLISIEELKRTYYFTEVMFKSFCDYCNHIANESWKNFSPKEADSWGADYDDYYDQDFDNNGSLIIRKNEMFIEGPYSQPKKNGERVRLIKFNKRKFESFVYDLNKHF
jgi:hypothetical protein